MTFAIAVDGFGVALASVLAVQVMLGYRLFGARASGYGRTHVLLGWAVVALILVHGVGAVIHTFQGTVETLPVSLDVMGVVIAAVLAVQIAAGYLVRRSRAMRTTHDMVALVLIVLVAAHGLIGYYHILTG